MAASTPGTEAVNHVYRVIGAVSDGVTATVWKKYYMRIDGVEFVFIFLFRHSIFIFPSFLFWCL
jgi:hypothetical protein